VCALVNPKEVEWKKEQKEKMWSEDLRFLFVGWFIGREKNKNKSKKSPFAPGAPK